MKTSPNPISNYNKLINFALVVGSATSSGTVYAGNIEKYHHSATVDHAYVAIANPVSDSHLEWRNIVATSNSEVFYTSSLRTDEALWSQIDALFGVWEHLDSATVDDLFDELRDRENNRLQEIYGDEW